MLFPTVPVTTVGCQNPISCHRIRDVDMKTDFAFVVRLILVSSHFAALILAHTCVQAAFRDLHGLLPNRPGCHVHQSISVMTGIL